MIAWLIGCWNKVKPTPKPKRPEWRIVQRNTHKWAVEQLMWEHDCGYDYWEVSTDHKTLEEAEQALNIVKNPVIKYY